MTGDAAFCAVLALAALLSVLASRPARPASRSYLRLAAVLYVALSIADESAIFLPGTATASFAQSVTLVVSALAPALLALALFATFEHPPKSWVAAMLLTPALLAGIAAAIGGVDVLSLAPLAASAFVILALSVRRWRLERRGPLHAIAAALCLLGGAAAGAAGGDVGRTALALFSAASVLGLSLALARRSRLLVEEDRRPDMRFAAIGGQR
ncbi:MAG TPA: hypothetical protein VIJ85_05025 [Rhizomicrobium sp.]